MDLESNMLSEISQRKPSTILFYLYVECNEQNKQSGDRLMDTENRLTPIKRVGVGRWVRRARVLAKEKKKDSWRQTTVW